jgi:hypothetical protein
MSCYILLPNAEMLSHLRFLDLKPRDRWRHFQSKHVDTRRYPKDMSTCIIPPLPKGAWQEHGIVASACAFENTAPTSSRDRFSQHCAAMASQLHAVVASRVTDSEGFAAGVSKIKNLLHHDHCWYLVRIMRWLVPPTNAEFGQGRSLDLLPQKGRSQLGERRLSMLAPLSLRHVPRTCA